MKKRRMTVHWEHAPALTESLPSLLLERTLFVQDRDRITCAGGTAPLDMMYALITQHHGADFARRVSDWFLHTEIRPSSGPQRAGLVERYGTTSRPVIQAIEIMENHIANPLELALIGNVSGMGKRQLNRLFREKLGVSTMAFYRLLRLEKAMGFLTQSTLTITDISLATGFANSAHFAQAFRAQYGATPSSFRR
jgi:transcriptional regulator GlxA family with amidase domain